MVPKAKPWDLRQQQAACKEKPPGQGPPAAGGLDSLRAKPPEELAHTATGQGEPNTSGFAAAMSTEECLALPSRTKLQPERLIFITWARRNVQVSKGAGQVEESPGRGAAFHYSFFGSTRGCREQKINLSAWLGPAVSLALHKQRNTLWFCSITATAGPSRGARSLLGATLMQDGST